MSYSSVIPSALLILTISLTYSTLNPVICPFAAAYFFLGLIVYKYNWCVGVHKGRPRGGLGRSPHAGPATRVCHPCVAPVPATHPPSMFVYNKPFETGGEIWVIIAHRIIVAVIIYQVGSRTCVVAVGAARG